MFSVVQRAGLSAHGLTCMLYIIKHYMLTHR